MMRTARHDVRRLVRIYFLIWHLLTGIENQQSTRSSTFILDLQIGSFFFMDKFIRNARYQNNVVRSTWLRSFWQCAADRKLTNWSSYVQFNFNRINPKNENKTNKQTNDKWLIRDEWNRVTRWILINVNSRCCHSVYSRCKHSTCDHLIV
jgi:hypothetical protein